MEKILIYFVHIYIYLIFSRYNSMLQSPEIDKSRILGGSDCQRTFPGFRSCFALLWFIMPIRIPCFRRSRTFHWRRMQLSETCTSTLLENNISFLHDFWRRILFPKVGDVSSLEGCKNGPCLSSGRTSRRSWQRHPFPVFVREMHLLWNYTFRIISLFPDSPKQAKKK